MGYFDWKSILCASLMLFGSAPANAADSLLSTFRDSFTLHHIYTKPDGTTDIEQVSVPVTHSDQPGSVPGILSLFAGPFDGAVRWKAGSTGPMPFHNAPRTEMSIVLQGDMVMTVSGGKEQRLRSGEVLLTEDYTGTGHSGRCEAVNQAMGCVRLFIFPKDDVFLRAIKRSGAGFCAANCNALKK